MTAYRSIYAGIPYRVKFRHWLPRLLSIGRPADNPVVATTVGSTIYVRGDQLPSTYHAHEWKHVEQFSRYGIMPALAYYLRALVFGHGYGLEHWAEKEAYVFASAQWPHFATLYARPE